MAFTKHGKNLGSTSNVAFWLAGAVLLALAPASASPSQLGSAIAWHADFEQAFAAARQSGRPVLAIFTASWAPAGGALDRTALASPEAAALVGVCFEPVCVDIDANPEATRRHGVTRVPLACVLSADDRLIASFDVPDQPAQFVAVAARAARAAGTAASPTAATAAPDENSPRSEPVTDTGSQARRSATISAFGSELPVPGVVPGASSGDGRDEHSAVAVAGKVRRLSAFATSDTIADPPAVTGTFQEPGAAAQNNTPWLSASGSTGDVAPAPRVDGVARFTDSVQQPGNTPHAAAARPPAVTAVTTPAVPAAPSARDQSAPQAAASASQQFVPATVGIAPAQAPAAAAVVGPAPAGGPAGTVAASPLAIEPAPQLPATPSAGATPWLEPQPRTASAAPPAAPAGVLAAAAPPTKPIEPQEKSAADRPAEPAAPKPAAGTAASFMAALQKPFTLFGKPAKPAKPATPEAKAANAADTPPTTVAAAESAASTDSLGSMPLGLEGYCPVTLAERGAWVEGRAQWGVRHRGRTYLFAGPEQQRAFLSDPDRYSPALSGDDPVLAIDAGRSTPGQRRYGVTYQARMYLFSSQETRDTFAANPQRYTTSTVVAENRSATVR